MAEQKHIKGKKDEGRHEGKAGEVRRLQATDYSLEDYRRDPDEFLLGQRTIFVDKKKINEWG